MASDRIDGLSRSERESLVVQFYGRPVISLQRIMELVDRAVAEGQGLSLVRVGDVVSSLLAQRFGAIQIWSFLGIPNPPPPSFLSELGETVKRATILGLTHRRPFAQWVARYLKREGIVPPHLTESFVNDALFAEGHLHTLMRRHRVALVGRAAAGGAERLAGQGLRPRVIIDLDNWQELDQAQQHLLDRGAEWEVALVGAGLAGRLLCRRLAQADRVALDVGHVLDGIAQPDIWNRPNRRQLFRQAHKAQKRIEEGSP